MFFLFCADAFLEATNSTVVNFSPVNISIAYHPTLLPTPVPTFAPTPLPTRCLDTGSFCELVVPDKNENETAARKYCDQWFCPTCAFAHDCDLT